MPCTWEARRLLNKWKFTCTKGVNFRNPICVNVKKLYKSLYTSNRKLSLCKKKTLIFPLT